jgi:hypothetical protein
MTYSYQRRKRRGGRGLMTLLILLLPAAVIILPTSMLLLAGLIPTIVAIIVDRDTEKSAALTVGAMNLCGVAPFIVQLWQQGHTIALAMRMLSTPHIWLVMFGAAALGWVMYFFIPQIVVAVASLRAQSKIKELEERRALLIADWGTEIMARPDHDKAEPAGLMENSAGTEEKRV